MREVRRRRRRVIRYARGGGEAAAAGKVGRVRLESDASRRDFGGGASRATAFPDHGDRRSRTDASFCRWLDVGGDARRINGWTTILIIGKDE